MTIEVTTETTGRGTNSCNACAGPRDDDGRIVEGEPIIAVRMYPEEHASSAQVFWICLDCRDTLIKGIDSMRHWEMFTGGLRGIVSDEPEPKTQEELRRIGADYAAGKASRPVANQVTITVEVCAGCELALDDLDPITGKCMACTVGF